MCDTMVALGNATADGSVLFAKNSDREPNEAHELSYIPHATHPEGATVRCTTIEVPQVQETNAVLLAKPFWTWGAEMGANEHGVVIGNEAVFTRVPYDKGPGLIGMDFVRLALERAGDAFEALQVITDLLEKNGQGGNQGFFHSMYYHNSFLLADPRQAWLLETAGRQWAAERVRDVRCISNAITIGSTWDLASEGLVDYAYQRGWVKGRDEFHFARCYSDSLYTRFSDARSRQDRVADQLMAHRGRITLSLMMSLLRDHGPDSGVRWSPNRGLTGADICMHAGFGPVRISQSTGSMVSQATLDGQVHWLTGTSAPCTGVFKPIWIDAGLPDLGPAPRGEYDRAALWWRHEGLHRAVLKDYRRRIELYREEREAMEQGFVGSVEDYKGRSLAERAAFSGRCFSVADEATSRWTERVQVEPVPWRFFSPYDLAWRRFNRQAGVPI